MLALSRALAKTRKPLHAVPRPHRAVSYTPKFTCNRHPYYAALTVSSFLRSLLLRSDGCCSAVHWSAFPPALMERLRVLEAAPHGLESCGPLPKEVIQGIALSLSSDVVETLSSVVLDGALQAPEEHHLLRELWPASLRKGYAEALVEERHAHTQRKKLGLLEPRFEAGLCSQTLMSELLERTVASAGEGTAASLAEGASRVRRLQERWRQLIDAYTLPFADRSRLHELENLPQEILLGEVVAECVSRSCALKSAGADGTQRESYSGLLSEVECVVDVGGGNGFLSAAVAERLRCRGVIVDPYYPPHAVDCLPSPWSCTRHRQRKATKRSSTLTRVTTRLKDLNWRTHVSSDPRRTVVIAKHLCGSGIDECLLSLSQQGALPSVLVLAPCCFAKVRLPAYCNPSLLRETIGVDTQAGFDRIGVLTDWNASCAPVAKHVAAEDSMHPRGAVALRGPVRQRGPSPPHAPLGACRSVAKTIPCMHALSQLIESLLLHGRTLWLRRHGYEVSVVRYVPDQVTPKCKCIIAVQRRDRPRGGQLH